jgi:uncharacterized protein YciI
MYYLLFYEKVPDGAERAQPLEATHLAYVQAAADSGELVLAGSLADPANGDAVLLFQSASPVTAERFAAGDPYVVHGIVHRWRVRAWQTVVGALPSDPHPTRSNTIIGKI